MKLGDKGEAVKNLQISLVNVGYKLGVDGDFGLETDRIVKLFQTAQGMAPDGNVGSAVLSALRTKQWKDSTEKPKLRTVTDRIAKAWFWSTQKAKYILGEGGREPTNATPFTPDKKGTLGSDCVGWVLWCLGIDRYQPKLFTYYDGWMNTDSIIDDAKSGVGGKLWKLLKRPEVGSLIIFPSLRSGGKMTRMGHVGLVVEVPAEWPDDFMSWSPKERTSLLKLVKVIDCNASFARRVSGKAIGVGTAAALWDKPDAVFVGWNG